VTGTFRLPSAWPTRASLKTVTVREGIADGLTVAAVAAYEKTGTISELTPTRARNLGKRPTVFN
jgi:hypothetical protein